MNMQAENPLGRESIPKLLLRYAVPSVVSMLVMSLYNIIDQIFIGRGVGYLGNTATTIAYPLTTVAQAIALMAGNGSAAFISLELGRGNHDKPQKILGNAMTLLAAVSVTYAAVVLILLRPVLTMLGATETVMPYAMDYAGIIMLGMPFNIMANSLSNVIRADGQPRYSMLSTMTGAVFNTILTPIFIFVLKTGVRGAAISTVLSQIIAWVIVMLYFLRFAKHTRLKPANMRPDFRMIGRIIVFGSANFITLGAITVVNIAMNNSLKIYGAMSAYGSDIPIAAQGIVMKINGMLTSTILGVALGAQPLIGFNYGAGNYERVRQTYKTVVMMTLSLAAVCNLVFRFSPEPLIALFGNSNPQFTEFACHAMRTYLCFVFTIGFQMPSGHYFQAIGKPYMSIMLSLVRQLLLLAPLILILPRFFGLDGILYAGPAGDVSSAVLTSVFIWREMRSLGRKVSEKPETAGYRGASGGF